MHHFCIFRTFPNGFVNDFHLFNAINLNSDAIRFMKFTCSSVKVDFDISLDSI